MNRARKKRGTSGKASGAKAARDNKSARDNKTARDVEKSYPVTQFIAKLRRWAEALERGDRFAIQVQNERIYVPSHAIVSVEHEREGSTEEVEFQIKWRSSGHSKPKAMRGARAARSGANRSGKARRKIAHRSAAAK